MLKGTLGRWDMGQNSHKGSDPLCEFTGRHQQHKGSDPLCELIEKFTVIVW